MKKEEILERLEEALRNWDDVVRRHETELRELWEADKFF